MTAATRRAGFLAAGLACLFGLGHLAWAGGIAVLGATPEQFEKIGQGSASHPATETAIGSVAMAGGLLGPALVQPWGSALPRRLLRTAPWAGAAVALPAAAYGIIGVIQQALAAAGHYEFPAGHGATADFQRWAAAKPDAIGDPEHRQLLERFLRWRLRHAAGPRPLPAGQATPHRGGSFPGMAGRPRTATR